MADIIDQAQDLTHFVCENQINKAKQAAKQVGTGYCLNCFEPLAATHSFCDIECREDHGKRSRMRGVMVSGFDSQ